MAYSIPYNTKYPNNLQNNGLVIFDTTFRTSKLIALPG